LASDGKRRQATSAGLFITYEGLAISNAGGITWMPVDPERGFAVKIRDWIPIRKMPNLSSALKLISTPIDAIWTGGFRPV
jgi:hypothetical protein